MGVWGKKMTHVSPMFFYVHLGGFLDIRLLTFCLRKRKRKRLPGYWNSLRPLCMERRSRKIQLLNPEADHSRSFLEVLTSLEPLLSVRRREREEKEGARSSVVIWLV